MIVPFILTQRVFGALALVSLLSLCACTTTYRLPLESAVENERRKFSKVVRRAQIGGLQLESDSVFLPFDEIGGTVDTLKQVVYGRDTLGNQVEFELDSVYYMEIRRNFVSNNYAYPHNYLRDARVPLSNPPKKIKKGISAYWTIERLNDSPVRFSQSDSLLTINNKRHDTLTISFDDIRYLEYTERDWKKSLRLAFLAANIWFGSTELSKIFDK